MSFPRSATQINLWRECQRKYGFQYIAMIRSPQTPSQALGTEVEDTQLQPYLRDGRTFDYTRDSGYIAASGLEYLPQPKVGVLQQKVELPGAHGRPWSYVGYIDLWLPNGGLPGLPAEVTVVDFKTTKNIKSWAKSADDLLVDVQANLYAAWAMLKQRTKQVRLRWLYFQTQGTRKAEPTDLVVTSEHAAKQFMAIDATAAEIHAALELVPGGLEGRAAEQYVLDTYPPTPTACDAFGGCPHRFRCNLGPSQFTDSLPTKGDLVDTAALLSRLKAKKAAPALEPPVPEALTRDYVPATAAGARMLGINPPPNVAQTAPTAPAQAAQAAAETAVEPAAAAEPKRRGRPKKAPEAPPAATEPAPAAATPPVEVITAEGETVVVTGGVVAASKAKPIGTLYIDSYPVGAPHTTAEALFADAAQRVLAEHHVADYRLIDFKGAGIFATTLAAVVDESALEAVVLDTRTPEGAIAKSVLVFRAERVVQGLR